MNKRDGDVAAAHAAPDDKGEDDDEVSAFAMLESHGGMQFLSVAAVLRLGQEGGKVVNCCCRSVASADDTAVA